MGDLNGFRNSNGRFAIGNPGGPGRPRRAVEQDYLIAVAEAVPLERFRKIAERAAEDAEKGNSRARQWLSDVLVGRRLRTSMTLAVTEKATTIDFCNLSNEEFQNYSNLYTRIRSGDQLSA